MEMSASNFCFSFIFILLRIFRIARITFCRIVIVSSAIRSSYRLSIVGQTFRARLSQLMSFCMSILFSRTILFRLCHNSSVIKGTKGCKRCNIWSKTCARTVCATFLSREHTGSYKRAFTISRYQSQKECQVKS